MFWLGGVGQGFGYKVCAYGSPVPAREAARDELWTRTSSRDGRARGERGADLAADAGLADARGADDDQLDGVRGGRRRRGHGGSMESRVCFLSASWLYTGTRPAIRGSTPSDTGHLLNLVVFKNK
jgi:hypothetical protein